MKVPLAMHMLAFDSTCICDERKVPFDRNVEVGNVMQDEVGQWLVLLFSRNLMNDSEGSCLPSLYAVRPFSANR